MYMSLSSSLSLTLPGRFIAEPIKTGKPEERVKTVRRVNVLVSSERAEDNILSSKSFIREGLKGGSYIEYNTCKIYCQQLFCIMSFFLCSPTYRLLLF